MKQLEALSPVDAAWFQLDEAHNTADIVALITFARPVEFERLRGIVEATFAAHPRFRQRVVEAGVGLPHWEEMPDFELTDHLVRTTLATGSQVELEDFVGDVLTTPLPRERPLWRMWVVENFGTGSALVVKVHHCVGDGFALVGVLLTMADDPPLVTPAGKEPPPDLSPRPSLGGQLWEGLVDVVRHPGHLADAARLSARVAGALGELVMLSFDTETALRRELTGVRRAAWSAGIDLQRFKRIASATHGTINDVLLAALSGALRAWLAAQADDVDHAAIRAIIPVNLRPVEEIGKDLGNRFGLVFLDIPVGEGDRPARLAAVRQSMSRLKQSPQPIVSFGILAALGPSPDVVEHLVGDLFTRKGSLVVTNVPGPRERLRLAGAEVDHIMFWVPHAALLGLGVSLLSYAGEVRIGVRADIAVMPEPAELVRAFEAELAAMEAELGG